MVIVTDGTPINSSPYRPNDGNGELCRLSPDSLFLTHCFYLCLSLSLSLCLLSISLSLSLICSSQADSLFLCPPLYVTEFKTKISHAHSLILSVSLMHHTVTVSLTYTLSHTSLFLSLGCRSVVEYKVELFALRKVSKDVDCQD